MLSGILQGIIVFSLFLDNSFQLVDRERKLLPLIQKVLDEAAKKSRISCSVDFFAENNLNLYFLCHIKNSDPLGFISGFKHGGTCIRFLVPSPSSSCWPLERNTSARDSGLVSWNKMADTSIEEIVPREPETAVFSRSDFMKESFSVDIFVGNCKGNVQLDLLKANLDDYLKSLKHALIELINEDYADFVNLSTNLVGVLGVCCTTTCSVKGKVQRV